MKVGSKVRYSSRWLQRWPDIEDTRGHVTQRILPDHCVVVWDNETTQIVHENWLVEDTEP